MLNLFGRSVAERAKSLAILALTSLLAVSLWNLSSTLSSSTAAQRQEASIAAAAARFATTLLTYDFEHLDVQRAELAGLCTAVVESKIVGSDSDVVAARASSIGAVASSRVIALSSTTGEVLVRTSQVEQSRFSSTPVKLSALLDIVVLASDSRWIITQFDWLTAPAVSV